MLNRIPERLRDIAIAAVMGGVAVVNVLLHEPTNLFVIVLVALAGVALAYRRSHTLLMLGVVAGVHAATLAAGNGDVIPISVVAFYSAAELLPRRTAVGAAALGAAPVLAVVLLDGSNRPSSSVGLMVFLAGAFVVGDNARVRRERQSEVARQAVADERARIARELHDVVTHNVSVMVVQAAAGNDVFEERPDRAREALQAVEETGRRALGELRSLLRVVGAEDAPQPGLARLADLVEQVRRTGIGVDLTVEGTPRELPAPVDVSAYRVVQESLTNTLKHARASRARIRVRYGRDGLEVEVADDGVGATSTEGGRGLAGMRERVTLLGGELSARNTPGGGFTVLARVPLETA
jgi:signal transduction histidine kinase